ncbi:uncharacterized protein LOC144702159 [Wolffia australiana]
MKGQPGGSQPWSRQQPGYNDLQLYQQQLMYKQLQEFQRQQQFHHLDRETWQQNTQSQLSSLSKQTDLDQLPPVVNGVPISDPAKYLWPSDNMVGTTNWGQGMGGLSIHKLSNGNAYSQDQAQMPQPAAPSSEQVDHYLYGTPISGNKTPLSQYSNFQAVCDPGVDSLGRSVGGQPEIPGQFNSFNSFQGEQGLLQGQMIFPVDSAVGQRFPGKVSFYQNPVQDARGSNLSENFERVSNVGIGVHPQDLRGGRPIQFEAQDMVKLDATEQRILFSRDDDATLGGAFDSRYTDSEGMYRNLLDGNSSLNALPSLQSGSWSALMQSAVAETSSGDTGLQNDWNSLSLRQEEPSTSNSPAFAQDYGKQQTNLMENLPKELSTAPRSFPLFNDAENTEKSTVGQPSAFFYQSTLKSAYNQEENLNAEVSHPVGKSRANSHFNGRNEPQMHFGDASAGVWTGLLREQQPNITPPEARSNSMNIRDSWAQQGNSTPYDNASQLYSRLNGWTQTSGDAGQKTHDYESLSRQSHAGNPSEIMLMQERDVFTGKTSGNEKFAAVSHSSSNLHFRNSDAGVPSIQVGKLHAGSSSCITLNDSKTALDANQQYFSVHQSDHSYSDKVKMNEDNGFQAWASPLYPNKAPVEFYDRREENDVQKEVPDEGYMSANSHPAQDFNGRVLGREKDYVTFGISSRPSSSGSAREQGLSHIPSHGPKYQEGGHMRSSQFDGSSFNSTNDLNKVTERGPSENNVFGGDSSIPNSCGESAASFAQHKRGHSGKNMLELLHKLDQSRETNSMGSHLFSNRNIISERSDAPPSALQQASTSQVTGLHLSLPSQPNPQTSRVTLNPSSRPNLDQLRQTNVTARLIHETQMEAMEDTGQSSEQRSNENSQAASISSSSPRFFSRGSQRLLQQQEQQSLSTPLRRPVDSDEFSKHTPDGSSQILSTSSDTRQAQINPSHTGDVGQIQLIGSPNTGIRAPLTSQSLTRPGGTQQGAFTAMLHNAWTQVSGQRPLPGNFSDKLNPNSYKSHSLSPSDEQSNQRGQQASKENSVRQILPAKSDAPREVLSRHPAIGNSPLGSSSFVQSYPQDMNKPKFDQSSQPEKQPSHSSLLNAAASARHFASLGPHLKAPDVQHHNYSLLQQMQTMKAVDSDPGKRLGKRLKSAVESAPDARQSAVKSSHSLIQGYSAAASAPLFKDLNLAGSQSQFSPDSKMLCFSSEGRASDSAVDSSQFSRKEAESRVLTGRGLTAASSSSPSMGMMSSRIDPQTAPSLFAHYEKLKDERSSSDQKAVVAAVPPSWIPTVLNSNEMSSSGGKANDSDQVESDWRMNSSAVAAEAVQPVELPTRKRRKPSLSDRSPWRSEISGVNARLSTISNAEASWAHAANRLVDKVDDDAGEDVPQSQRARRRLVLTAQLTQQLLPALPAKVLRADAITHYESVTYLAARLALGRACGSILDQPSSSSSAEDFVARARKMEEDLTRLEGAASIADLRVECQDLERFSLINRFARFHSRGQHVGVESLPTSEAAHRRIHPQRYVAALPMPSSMSAIAEGMSYVSL